MYMLYHGLPYFDMVIFNRLSFIRSRSGKEELKGKFTNSIYFSGFIYTIILLIRYKYNQFIYPSHILEIIYFSLLKSKLIETIILWWVHSNKILLLRKKLSVSLQIVHFAHIHIYEPSLKEQNMKINDLYVYFACIKILF